MFKSGFFHPQSFNNLARMQGFESLEKKLSKRKIVVKRENLWAKGKRSSNKFVQYKSTTQLYKYQHRKPWTNIQLQTPAQEEHWLLCHINVPGQDKKRLDTNEVPNIEGKGVRGEEDRRKNKKRVEHFIWSCETKWLLVEVIPLYLFLSCEYA